MVSKAMIMAAGVGSRLEPLTLNVPKPLVPVCNRPVMDILLDNLKSIGINDVIANTYYLAEQIIKRYSQNNSGTNFNYVKEETLSGTAGGLKKCQFFFDKGEDFVVLSADGLSNADIKKGIEIHKKSGAVATIGIKQLPMEEIPHFGVVVTDEEGFITEFQEKPAIAEAKSNYINTGIYIFNYKIFDYIPENTFYDFAKNVFPVLLKERQINTFEIDGYWSDIGTLAQYKMSTQDVFRGDCMFVHEPLKKTFDGAYISETVYDNVRFIGNSTIGNGCKIGKNVTLENCILWDNVIIDDGVTLTNCVVASNSSIHTNLSYQIIGANQKIEKEKVELS